MIDVLFLDEQVILAATAQMPSLRSVINLATLHMTAPTQFPLRNTTPPRQISSKHQYTHTQRDRSHSTYYGARYGRHFSRSQSCCCSHCDRSTSFGRHTSCSSSNQCNSSHCPSTDRCPHHLAPWHQPAQLQPIPQLPLLPQTLLMPLHRPELVSLQQLPPHCTWSTAKKSQASSKTLNPP